MKIKLRQNSLINSKEEGKKRAGVWKQCLCKNCAPAQLAGSRSGSFQCESSHGGILHSGNCVAVSVFLSHLVRRKRNVSLTSMLQKPQSNGRKVSPFFRLMGWSKRFTKQWEIFETICLQRNFKIINMQFD